MSELPCPACRKVAMEPCTDSSTELEIDTCPECQGMWFDGGELRRFFRSPGLKQRFLIDDRSQPMTSVSFTISNRARGCPRCRTRMDQPLVSDVTVDVCRSCHGVWLDYGELKRIVQKFRNKTLDGEPTVVDQVRSGMSPLGAFQDVLEQVMEYLLGIFRKIVPESDEK